MSDFVALTDWAWVLGLVGLAVAGGIYGRIPPLDTAQLENGRNLAFHTDFRSVYATIIANWLNADPVPLLGGSFPLLKSNVRTPSSRSGGSNISRCPRLCAASWYPASQCSSIVRRENS